MQPKNVMILCIALSAVILVLLLQNTPHTNSASRLATIESLVHRGTFTIDDSRFNDTSDRVVINDHYYSSKPPMLSVIVSGGYLLFTKISGITFESSEATSIAFVNLLAGVLPYLLLIYFFYRFLTFWTDSRKTIILSLLVFTFNFIGLGYATDLNNHTPAAVCLFISFYFAFRIRNGASKKNRYWILSGLLGGLAAAFEFWAGFFVVAFAVYISSGNLKKLMICFLPAAALPVAAHFILTLTATGSLLPVYLRPELYQFEGSYWIYPTGIDALHEPKYVYFFHILLGHHGFLSMTPVFLLSVYSIWKAIRGKTEKYAEALAISIPLLITVLFLGIKTRNYGGVCAGLRWMILAMPLLFLFLTDWIDKHKSKKAFVLLLILASIGLAVTADIPWSHAGPWHNSGWHKYLFGLY